MSPSLSLPAVTKMDFGEATISSPLAISTATVPWENFCSR
jgi:hypothetical protein